MAINLEQVDSQVAAARGNKGVARAQAILAQFGHYSGGVDGIIGGKTREAIGKLLENQAAFEALPSDERSRVQTALQDLGRVALNAENGEVVKTANKRIDEFQRSCAQREAATVAAVLSTGAQAPASVQAPAVQAAPEQEVVAPLPPTRPADVPKFANAQEERVARIRDAQGVLHDKGYYPQGVTRDQAADGKIGPQTREAAAKAKEAVGKATVNGAEVPAELQDVAKAQETVKELGGESAPVQQAAAPKAETEAAPRRRARPAAAKQDDDEPAAARPKAAHKSGNSAARGKGGKDRLEDFSYDANGVPRFNERSGASTSPEELNRGPGATVKTKADGTKERFQHVDNQPMLLISGRSQAIEQVPLKQALKIVSGGGIGAAFAGNNVLYNKEGERLEAVTVPPHLDGRSPQEIAKAMGLTRNQYAVSSSLNSGGGVGSAAASAASTGAAGGCCGGSPGGPGR